MNSNPGFSSLPPSPVLVTILAAIVGVVAVVVFTVILIRTRLTGFTFAFSVIVIITALGLGAWWTIQTRDNRGKEVAHWLAQQHDITVSGDEALQLLEGGNMVVDVEGVPSRIEFVHRAGSEDIFVYVSGQGRVLDETH
jgi:uncharacterized protein YacL